jgi:hypothetical protein
MLRIAVCGDNSIAHSIAAICATRGNFVSILSNAPKNWHSILDARLPDDSRRTCPLLCVTDQADEALAEAELVFVCVPHWELELVLKHITGSLSRRAIVGAVPGFGGFMLLAREVLGPDQILFGSQRIPFVVRAYDWGRSVWLSGIRRQSYIGTVPNRASRAVTSLVGEVLGVRAVPVSHYINIELSPSNSLVNPARLYRLFGPDAEPMDGEATEFFTHWDLPSAKLLLRLDAELQNARSRLPRDTSFVAPLLLQYDACDANMLTDQFRRLNTLVERPIPYKAQDGSSSLEIPFADVTSTYFTEDVDIGLRLLRGVCRVGGAATPLMDKILIWWDALPRAKKVQAPQILAYERFEDAEQLARALD